MATGNAKPVLCVESQHDQHVVIHLVKRHGVNWSDNDHPVNVKNSKNDSGVLNAIRDEVDAAKGTGRAVGFILDIDTTAVGRWAQVEKALKTVGMNPPHQPVIGGYIEKSLALNVQVGVWLMPDNQLYQGDLEDFLKTLLPNSDKLYAFAEKSSEEAILHDAKYMNPKDRKKANLHCWLAWQEEPGVPYGQAINFKYFESQSAEATAFVTWFKTLFSII